jgi:hypothetical protein
VRVVDLRRRTAGQRPDRHAYAQVSRGQHRMREFRGVSAKMKKRRGENPPVTILLLFFIKAWQAQLLAQLPFYWSKQVNPVWP